MSTNIVFIEACDEIDLIESYIKSDTIVISSVPAVSSELKKRGILFQTTLEFFGNQGHHYVHNKSLEIIEEIRPFLNFKDSANVSIAYEKTWIFYFRFHLNYILSMLFIIDKVVKKYGPSKFIAIPNLNYKNNHANNFLNEIVALYANFNSIEILYTNERKKHSQKNNLIVLLMGSLKRLIFEIQFIFFRIISKNRKSIFALEDTYNMPNLIEKISKNVNQNLTVFLSIQRKSLQTRVKEMLKGKIFFFTSLSGIISSKNYKIFDNQINNSVTEIKKYLNINSKKTKIFGPNINILLIDFIDNTLNKKMHHLNGEINSIKRILRVHKPNKVFSQHSLGVGYALGEICLQSNIPALLVTHGSHVHQDQPIPSLEWSIHSQTIFNSHYPFVAIKSPCAEQFLDKQVNVISKKIITGPLMISQNNQDMDYRLKLKKNLYKLNSNDRILVHAGTPKGWGSLRPWIYETLDEYINNINDLIKAVDGINGLFFAIRFRSQKDFSLDDLKSLLFQSDCYDVYEDGLFEEYLVTADFLISYSSTTIEEALQYNVPVIQYDSDNKYEHIASEMLNNKVKNYVSPIYSVSSKKDLGYALNWLNENHMYSENKNLSWFKYTYEYDAEMGWLDLMDL
jgi:hypothetical protein